MSHLLEKEDTDVCLRGHAEEYADFMEDKITWLLSQIDASVVAGMMEAPGGPVVWEWFDPAAPDVVDRILGNMISTTCILYPCPSWRVKVSW